MRRNDFRIGRATGSAANPVRVIWNASIPRNVTGEIVGTSGYGVANNHQHGPCVHIGNLSTLGVVLGGLAGFERCG
jgi:hypothetical protein